ncbi:MAG: hypothetical protein QF463_02340 [Vicinamibacterales bacterium]|jgi:hypothetical protein|nr:hypothetical protein [Vicinamibacterales bacterium]MDP6607885.1 hypothetical protein [Vicinamibacterales bacterium]HAK56460.1 hypothetical protein [Acidobacteriota bacterium]
MTLFFLTALVIGAAMLVMAVGVVFSNRCLRGSCGGPDVLGPDGAPLSCETCPRRAESPAPPPGA